MNPVELQFKQELQNFGITLADPIYNRLFAFLKALLEANKITNLTAITDYDTALSKHLFDSLAILNLDPYRNAVKILDVGSGPGLPSIPLAICSPTKTFTSLEATAKKVNFQTKVCSQLEITNHTAIWSRAEALAHRPEEREKYDLVLARALAPAATLAELTLPFVRPFGFALFYKGKSFQDELDFARTAITVLGGKVTAVKQYRLPAESGEHNIIIIKKINQSPPQYPRRSGIPQKSPLK
ncbi:MAG TPA: 16S rRNA (guanine(527)-N(7))-methyltransferase RsmG [Bacillota bacterium]